MELCSFGPVSDLVASLTRSGRNLNEDQIAYIIKVQYYFYHNLFMMKDSAILIQQGNI